MSDKKKCSTPSAVKKELSVVLTKASTTNVRPKKEPSSLQSPVHVSTKSCKMGGNALKVGKHLKHKLHVKELYPKVTKTLHVGLKELSPKSMPTKYQLDRPIPAGDSKEKSRICDKKESSVKEKQEKERSTGEKQSTEMKQKGRYLEVKLQRLSSSEIRSKCRSSRKHEVKVLRGIRCNKCSLRFQNVTALKIHRMKCKAGSGSTTALKCEQCGKMFFSILILAVHRERCEQQKYIDVEENTIATPSTSLSTSNMLKNDNWNEEQQSTIDEIKPVESEETIATGRQALEKTIALEVEDIPNEVELPNRRKFAEMKDCTWKDTPKTKIRAKCEKHFDAAISSNNAGEQLTDDVQNSSCLKQCNVHISKIPESYNESPEPEAHKDKLEPFTPSLDSLRLSPCQLTFESERVKPSRVCIEEKVNSETEKLRKQNEALKREVESLRRKNEMSNVQVKVRDRYEENQKDGLVNCRGSGTEKIHPLTINPIISSPYQLSSEAFNSGHLNMEMKSPEVSDAQNLEESETLPRSFISSVAPTSTCRDNKNSSIDNSSDDDDVVQTFSQDEVDAKVSPVKPGKSSARYFCDDCEESFKNNHGLKIHLARGKHKERSKTAKMMREQQTYTLSLAATGKRKKQKTGIRCKRCNKRCKSITVYKVHLKVCDGPCPTGVIFKHVCHFCKKKFTDILSLNKHVSENKCEHMLLAQERIQNQPKPSCQDLSDSADRPTICSICGVVFSDQTELKKHVANMHPENVDGNGKLLDTNGGIITGKSKICYYCCAIFHKESEYEKHCCKQKRQAEKMRKCPKCRICSKEFMDIETLQKHQQLCKNICEQEREEKEQQRHDGSRCVCGRFFLSERAYQEHREKHERDEEFRGTFNCKFCEMNFHTAEDLDVHWCEVFENMKSLPPAGNDNQDKSI